MKPPLVNSGFRNGLRQATVKLTLNLQVPRDFSHSIVDAWMLSALETDVSAYKPVLLDDATDKDVCLPYLLRLLLTTTVLLQDIKVPSFERVAIESIQHSITEPTSITTIFWFPAIDEFSIKDLEIWIGIAHHLLSRVCATSGDHQALEELVESLHQQHFKPWLNRMPGGKSLIPILQTAFEIGIPFVSCGAGRYALGWGTNSRIFDRSSNVQDSYIGAQISHRKDQAIQLMKKVGIPVPYGVVINRQSSADTRSIKHPPPWVVKPVDKDRGEGVTLGIEDPTLLQHAIDTALKLSKAALVEEQIPGTCHRILVVNGQVIFVVKRNPKSIIGDGQLSVRQLVKQHNCLIRQKIPIKRLPEITLDDIADACLAQRGMDAESVPAMNQKVDLRPAQSALWGGDPEVVTHMLHPANAEIAFRAAKLFDLSCAGIDFISTDISTPWFNNGAVINEVNYAPVLGRTHAYQRLGTKKYLETLFPFKGRVPIDVYVGHQSSRLALQRHKELTGVGIKAFFCNDSGVLNQYSNVVPFANAMDTFTRVEMLRLNADLQHLIVHLEDDDSFVRCGLPFEYVSTLNTYSENPLTETQFQTVQLLKQFLQAT